MNAHRFELLKISDQRPNSVLTYIELDGSRIFGITKRVLKLPGRDSLKLALQIINNV